MRCICSNAYDFLKGFYDTYPDQTRVLVTGSAKLDVFSRGGDSLMGRYFQTCFMSSQPIIVPASTFLSQLV